MASKEDPEQPLAPAAHRIPIDHDNDHDHDYDELPVRKGCLKCCGCVSALLLILSLVLLILFFTLLKLKDPILKLNSISLLLYGLNNTNQFNITTTNFTILIDVYVKNPNIEAFKFGNSTTEIYYGGMTVGGSRNPAGGMIVGAGRTVGMNTTAEVMGWKLMQVPRLGDDLRTGEIKVNGCTRVGGKVEILNLIKKHVVVTMNCTFTVNLNTTEIEDQDCHQKVSS
ncbi:uncharacterized protein LOC124928835 [Impatiens glandulifera]|uniref:uncharacterized protein LOC124928835 n=1 Tax=Impatiens glandulifera TaxID=253017 RepID=UPI001FB14DD2|nr:uncharacterized protein LOC124928835 [Impatiens glandulifera]